MARGRPLVRLIKLMLTLGGRPGRTAAELAALRGSGGRREQLRLGSEPPRRSRASRAGVPATGQRMRLHGTRATVASRKA